MQGYDYASSSHAHATPQGHAPSASCPGYATSSVSIATSTPALGTTHALSASAASVFGPVQVPPGCYPIELVQFWRGEHERGQPLPLHWALFVRTAPGSFTHGGVRPRRPLTTSTTTTSTHGHYYEIVGSPDTYTAQFLSHVTFEPDMLPDWRGTHVIGWMHPGQLTVFEQVVRQVPVWRQRSDWRCQHWVYEVIRTVGGDYPGVFVDRVTLVGLQQHMARLLDAWESGDI